MTMNASFHTENITGFRVRVEGKNPNSVLSHKVLKVANDAGSIDIFPSTEQLEAIRDEIIRCIGMPENLRNLVETLGSMDYRTPEGRPLKESTAFTILKQIANGAGGENECLART